MLCRAVIRHFNLKRDSITFVWSGISAEQRFGGHQVGVVADGDGFFVVVSNGVRIVLIASSGRGGVGADAMTVAWKTRVVTAMGG